MTTSRRDAAALALVIFAALLVGELWIYRRPDLTRTAAFLVGDPAYSLFVTSEVLGGARLYQDVAYVYGWLPVALYSAFAAVFGNTPIVYLQFLLVVSTLNLALAYVLLRRVLQPGLAAFVTIVGLLPVFLVPGSLLGGYISSFYLPLERTVLLLVALAWRPPARRSTAASAVLGVLVAVLQAIKFGPGIVLLAVLIAFDAVLTALDPARPLSRWLRHALTIAGVAAAGEAVIAAAAFALLPRPVAWDLIWPDYLVHSYPPAARRWPGWAGWRVTIGQYANPLAGSVLSAIGGWLSFRRAIREPESRAAVFMIFPLLFVAGAFTFFRTEHHFRQFAWTLLPGSAVAVASRRWCRALAVAGWLPVAAVVAHNAVRAPDAGAAEVVTDAGWRLAAGAAEKTRIESIVRALRAIRESHGDLPVLFYPNGAGFYVAYRIPHVSRQTWFFQGSVRPYDVASLVSEYRALGAVVACRDEGNTTPLAGAFLHEDVPREIRASLEARIAETVWRDDQCAVFRLTASR